MELEEGTAQGSPAHTPSQQREPQQAETVPASSVGAGFSAAIFPVLHIPPSSASMTLSSLPPPRSSGDSALHPAPSQPACSLMTPSGVQTGQSWGHLPLRPPPAPSLQPAASPPTRQCPHPGLPMCPPITAHRDLHYLPGTCVPGSGKHTAYSPARSTAPLRCPLCSLSGSHPTLPGPGTLLCPWSPGRGPVLPLTVCI